MEPSETKVLYRLRGQLDGVERIFELADGENRVGSSAASDLRLAVNGVSRQHAVLRLTPGGLVVEDRGSKNGTFVNGSRVERASVPAGARIAFGAAELMLDVVETDDARLAVELDPDPGETVGISSRTDLSHDTASLPVFADPSVAQAWLTLLAGFAERLFATPQGETGDALTYLVQSLGAKGACLVEWVDGRRPVVLTTRGEIGKLPPYREVRARKGPSFHAGETVVRAAMSDGENPPLELCVWGEFAGRSGSRPLLGTLLLLLDRLRDWELEVSPRPGAVAPARPAQHELAFPEGYQPAVSQAMTAVYRQLRPLARRDLPILLTGETGVGKERLAEILHRTSPQRDGPFLAINCAAIPQELLEAELFGIGKGVATGVEARSGRFQQADGGTLFLDEVGEMQPSLQVKLLRVLQEKKVQVVGGPAQSVDVRIVAATNADLDRRMEQGTFRPDLYYRLAGVEVRVPPLRECREDIPHLIEHFLSGFVRQSGIRVRGITVKAFRRLGDYGWPGNVRELRHEIRRLVYLCSDGEVVDAGKLSPRIVSAAPDPPEEPGGDEELKLAPRVEALERRLLSEALRRTEGRQVRAARLLGLSRNGLAEKLKRLGIDPRTFRGQGAGDREEG